MVKIYTLKLTVQNCDDDWNPVEQKEFEISKALNIEIPVEEKDLIGMLVSEMATEMCNAKEQIADAKFTKIKKSTKKGENK